MTDVAGVRVGHYTDPRRPTGCTAVLFDEPATAGADYDGSAPGEMLGVMLQPVSPVDRIHGILLTGGGVRLGLVHGRSDRQGAYPAENPVSSADHVATVY